MDKAKTYRSDLYYINYYHGHGMHSEGVVSPVKFWFVYLTQFWRFRRWRNVLREHDDT